MFNLSKDQMMVFASEYVARNGISMRDILTFNPIANYLRLSLDDDQLEWLSYDVQKNPQGLKMFIQSVAGRKAMEQVFIQYQEHRHKTLVPPNHVKLV